MVPPEHAQYLNCLTSAYIGRIYFYLTDFAGSIAHVQSNIPHLERQGRAAEAANSLSLLTLNYAFTGTFEESVSLFAAITEIADSRNNPGIMALCKLCQGFTALLRGDWEEAGVLLPDAAEISSKIGNHTIAGLAIWGRGRRRRSRRRPPAPGRRGP